MSTFGTGTFGSGTFGTLGASGPTSGPTGINDLIGLDDPSVTFVAAAYPDGDLTLDVAVDAPSTDTASTVVPDGINDAATLDDPTAAFAATVAVNQGPAEPVTSDAPTAGTAPPLETFTDNFPGSAIDTTKWPTRTGTLAVSGNSLRITSGAVGAATYSTAQTAAGYDFTGSYFIAQVTAPLQATIASLETSMRVYRDGNNRVGFLISGNTIYTQIFTGGVETRTRIGGTFNNYNPTAHKWWRIRHSPSDGKIYWGVSADGATWTDVDSVVVSWPVTSVYGYIACGKYTAGDAQGYADFANINLPMVATTATPDGINDATATDDPTAAMAAPVPDGIGEPVASDDPATSTAALPDDIGEPVTSDDPSIGVAAVPDGINDAVTSDDPALTLDTAATPTGINLLNTQDDPVLTLVNIATPDGINDAVTSDDPTTVVSTTPSGINDATAQDPPTAGFNTEATPGDLNDTIAADNPSGAYLRIPTSINDAVTIDAPTASTVVVPTPIAVPVASDNVALGYLGGPVSINDVIAMGPPTASMVVVPSSITFTITNGTAPTSGQNAQVGEGPAIKPQPGAAISLTLIAFTIGAIIPEGISVPFTLTGTDMRNASPYDGIAVPITLDGTDMRDARPNGIALDAAISDVRATPSNVYPDEITVPITIGGTDMRNASPGGIAVPITIGGTDFPKPVYTPLVPLIRAVIVPPTHLLGIGPWYPNIEWGGAPNHGALSGTYAVSAPVVNLPVTTSKSFTLRLNGADEARADFDVPRDQAFLIEERSTDLWWRRRDNRRGIVESIGRFNANNVDIASTENAKIRVSATFSDYRAQLEDRLILTYRDGPPKNTSTWEKGTPVTDLLRFIIPVNLRLDLSELDTANLGNVVEAIEMNPGRTVGDAMGEIQSLSTYPWEWWIEMPEDSAARPKLRFAPAGRGRNRGVSLVDTGGGESPITSFTMQAAGEKYANTLYYTGTAGGVLIAKMDEVARYGQRDAQESTSGLVGNVAAITKAGNQRLSELLQRPLSWSLTLREGYWEGRSHIDVGDIIGVSIRFGKQMLSDNYRVSEISGSIEDDGRETVTVSVGPPRPARDPRSRYSAIGKLVRTIKDPVVHDNTPAPKLGETPYITVNPWYGAGNPPAS